MKKLSIVLSPYDSRRIAFDYTIKAHLLNDKSISHLFREETKIRMIKSTLF